MGKTIKINPADIAWVNEQLGDFESHLENSDQIVLPIDLEDLLDRLDDLSSAMNVEWSKQSEDDQKAADEIEERMDKLEKIQQSLEQ